MARQDSGTANRPDVSVVMPSFNHAPFLAEAIESVLAQDVALELLIQDDCSTDDSWQILQRFDDPRVIAVRTLRNRASHPRNFARRRVRGRYVAFMSSDDRWLAGKLRAQIEVLDAAPPRSLCFTGARLIGRQGEPVDIGWSFVSEIPDPAWLLRRFLDRGNCVCVTSAMLPTRFLDELGWFHPTLLHVGDWDLWIRALVRAEAVYSLPQMFTEARYLGGSDLSSNPTLRRRFEGESLAALDRFLERPGLKRFRSVFDPEHALRLPPVPFAAKRLWIVRRAMTAREPLCRLWGVSRYQALLRRRGYAWLSEKMFGRGALEDYDAESRASESRRPPTL